MPVCAQNNKDHKIGSFPLSFSDYRLNNYGEYENGQSEKFYLFKDIMFVRTNSLITPENGYIFYYHKNGRFMIERTVDEDNIEIKIGLFEIIFNRTEDGNMWPITHKELPMDLI